MSVELLIELLKTILLGKSGPGVDANPLVVVAWLFVPGLLGLARELVRKDRDGAAAACVGLAMLLGGALVTNGYWMAVRSAAEPTNKSGPAAKSAPPSMPPRPGSPLSSAARFERYDGITLTGRALAPGRSMSVADCELTCAGDTECVAFVYDSPAQVCQLKKEIGGRSPLSGSIAGIKTTSR